MQQYKVVALYLSGKGKKMFRSGDIITAADLVEGEEEAAKRLANGFIAKYDALKLPEVEEAVILPEETTIPAVDENADQVVEDAPETNTDTTSADDSADKTADAAIAENTAAQDATANKKSKPKNNNK